MSWIDDQNIGKFLPGLKEAQIAERTCSTMLQNYQKKVVLTEEGKKVLAYVK